MIASLTVPWPPTVNTYWRHAQNRKTGVPMVYVTAKGTAYRREVARLALAAGLHKVRFAGRVRAEYSCYPPDKRIRDLSNLLKCLEDALVDAGIIEDDGQIDAIHMWRLYPEKPGRVEVRLYAV